MSSRINVLLLLFYLITDDLHFMAQCTARLPYYGTYRHGQFDFVHAPIPLVFINWYLEKNSQKKISKLFPKNRNDCMFLFLLFIKSRSSIEIFTDRSLSRSIKVVDQFQMVFLAFNITLINTIIGTNCL